jgi:hypothetical protein
LQGFTWTHPRNSAKPIKARSAATMFLIVDGDLSGVVNPSTQR